MTDQWKKDWPSINETKKKVPTEITMKTLQEKFIFKQMKKKTTTKSFLILQVKN